MEEDDLDLMLPSKKKRHKKVEFEEGTETLEKDDGELRKDVFWSYAQRLQTQSLAMQRLSLGLLQRCDVK